MSDVLAPGAPLDDLIPGAINLRDLGGRRTADGRTVRRGLLYRAGMTHHMPAEGLAELRDRLGVRTVIDFRNALELDRDGLAPLADHGITHVHLPIEGSTVLTPEERKVVWEEMRLLQRDWTAAYQKILTDRPDVYVAFFAAIAAPGHLPAVFHCSAGRDRTGIAAALVLGLAGVDDDQIVEDYHLTGAYLPRHVERFAGHYTMMGMTPEEFARVLETDAAHMRRLLEGLRSEHGSVRSFLEYLGVPASTLRAVHEMLVV
ncbi:MAG: tyrosine-protein phosphatase [Dehalococcoidia bacterium]